MRPGRLLLVLLVPWRLLTAAPAHRLINMFLCLQPKNIFALSSCCVYYFYSQLHKKLILFKTYLKHQAGPFSSRRFFSSSQHAFSALPTGMLRNGWECSARFQRVADRNSATNINIRVFTRQHSTN